MKKRLVIDGIIFGLQESGGISRHFAELLEALDSTDYEIFLLLPRNRNVEWQLIAPRLKNIRVLKRKRFRWGARSFLRDQLYLSLVAWRIRPTLWHSSYYGGLPLYPCPKILSFYDMIPEVLKSAIPYDTAMKYKAACKADRLLSISESTQNDIETIWPTLSAKSRVLPLFVNQTLPSSLVYDDTPYLLYVGRREGYKNFLPTMNLLLKDNRFSSLRIKVAGGEKEWSEEEKRLLDEPYAKDRLELLGVLPHGKIEELIASCQALLFPSLYEGFGIPLLEAFSAKVPVVAFRTSSIPEVVGEDYPLAKLDDPQSFGDTLAKLFSEREKWIKNGEERLSVFSKQIFLKRLLELYEEALYEI